MNKLTLKELSTKLNISEKTIKKYCKEFDDFLDIDLASFDYTFNNKILEKIEIIREKLNKPTYPKVKKDLQKEKIKDEKKGRLLNRYGAIGSLIGAALGFFALIKQIIEL